MRHLHARVYADDVAKSRSLTDKEKIAYGLGITAAGAAGGLVLGSLAVSAVGSAAVALHTGVGHVFAGGLLTSLKTAGLFGLRAVGLGALTAAGAAAGGMVGSILVGNEKKSIPVEDLQKVFDKYDTDKDGFIMNSQIKNIFKDLDLDLKEEEQIDLFFKATKRPFDIYGDISYKDYLKLFQVKSLDKDSLRTMLNNLYIKVEDTRGYVSLEDVKEILPLLNVNATDEDVEEVYKNVSNGGSGKLVSRLQFLEIFGFDPMKAVSETLKHIKTKQSLEIPETQETISETLKKVCRTVSNVGNGNILSRFQFSEIFSFEEPTKTVSETQELTKTQHSPEKPDTHGNSETQKEVNGNVSNGGGSRNPLSWFQISEYFSFEEPSETVLGTQEPTETQHLPDTHEASEALKKPEIQNTSKTLYKSEIPEAQKSPETQETSDISKKSETQETSKALNKPEIPEAQKFPDTQETSEITKIPEKQETSKTLKKQDRQETIENSEIRDIKQKTPRTLKKLKRRNTSKTRNKPEAQKSTETRKTSEIPKKPETQETSKTLNKLDAQKFPDTQETSEIPNKPETQETETLKKQDRQETTEKSEIGDTEDISHTLRKIELPEEQKTPDTLKKPEAEKISETQKKLETVETLKTPDTLKKQEITDTQVITEAIGEAFNNLKDIWNKYL